MDPLHWLDAEHGVWSKDVSAPAKVAVKLL
jgi:hypothetical protein